MKNPLRFKAHKCIYTQYLEQPNHKAVFVRSGHSNTLYTLGYVVAAGSIKSAMTEAKAKGSCELFDLDGELVVNVSNLDL